MVSSSLEKDEEKNEKIQWTFLTRKLNHVFSSTRSIFTWYWLGMMGYARSKAIAYSHSFTEMLYKQSSNLFHAVMLVCLLYKKILPPRNWAVFLGLPLKYSLHCYQHRALLLNDCTADHFHFLGVHSAAEFWHWPYFQELCPMGKFNSSHTISLHFKWHTVQSLLLLSTLILKEHLSLIPSLLYLLWQNMRGTEECLKD